MFRSRNLLAVGIAVVALIFMTTWVSAQPLQQDTPTPEATTVSTETPVPTVSATETPMPTAAATNTLAPTEAVTATAVAPAVSPLATPVGTPSTLPTTGASDDGTAAFSLLLMAAGAVILVSILGLAVSRRSR